MEERIYQVYILTNQYHTTLYTGVTNNLYRRLDEHISGVGSSFVKRYNLTKLVYCELFEDPRSAITREKQIKGGSRKSKVELIESINPEWKDLLDDL